MEKTHIVWESYGHKDNECTLWKTQDLAESHDFYEIDFCTESNVVLTDEEVVEIENGLPVWA